MDEKHDKTPADAKCFTFLRVLHRFKFSFHSSKTGKTILNFIDKVNKVEKVE